MELADDGLSVTGEVTKVYEGWRYPEDWVVEGYSLEGPKVTFHNGYYYLTVAVGGTAGPPTSHMAVSSRSRTPWGPWEHSPYNPVVRTWSREEAWWSKGHVSLIDSPDGQWWIVYHAYANGYHTLGRQTLLEPIEWTEDGWFRPVGHEEIRPSTERFRFHDSFQDPVLQLDWQTEGTEPDQRFRTGSGGLIALGAPQKEQHSPLFYMPAHKGYMAEVEVALEGEAEGRLILYYNNDAYFGLGVHSRGVRLIRSFKSYATMPSDSGYAWVRIVNDEHLVSFYYSFDGAKWMKYDKVVEASGFHHNTLGGFQSLRIGLDAVGSGKAVFRKFTYKEL